LNLKFESELIGIFAQKSIKNNYLFIFFPLPPILPPRKFFIQKGAENNIENIFTLLNTLIVGFQRFGQNFLLPPHLPPGKN